MRQAQRTPGKQNLGTFKGSSSISLLIYKPKIRQTNKSIASELAPKNLEIQRILVAPKVYQLLDPVVNKFEQAQEVMENVQVPGPEGQHAECDNYPLFRCCHTLPPPLHLHVAYQVDHPAGVAKFVVIPGEQHSS